MSADRVAWAATCAPVDYHMALFQRALRDVGIMSTSSRDTGPILWAPGNICLGVYGSEVHRSDFAAPQNRLLATPEQNFEAAVFKAKKKLFIRSVATFPYPSARF